MIYTVYINLADNPLKYPPNKQMQRAADVAQKIRVESGNEKMNLAVITPQPSKCSTNTCLVSNQEYLVYRSTSSGQISVDMSQSPGTFSIEWFNPATGQVSDGGVTTGGQNRSFTPPFASDVVLYLKSAAIPSTNPSPSSTPAISPLPSPSGSLPSPVVAYNFDQGSGTTLTDFSGNNFHATINNASWTTSGKYNSALIFNGTNSYTTVSDPGNSLLDFPSGSNITLTAWVYPTSFSSSTGYSTVIAKGGTENSDLANYYLQYANSGLLAFCYRDANNSSWVCYETSSSPLVLNSWQHLALTYTFSNAASLKFYYNGNLLAGSWGGANGNLSPAISNEPLWIGADNFAGGAAVDEPVNSIIDQVRVYSRALSQTEIQNDMTTPI